MSKNNENTRPTHAIFQVVGDGDKSHLDQNRSGVASQRRTYPVLQWAVPIHPTVSELIPTVLGDLKPVVCS